LNYSFDFYHFYSIYYQSLLLLIIDSQNHLTNNTYCYINCAYSSSNPLMLLACFVAYLITASYLVLLFIKYFCTLIAFFVMLFSLSVIQILEICNIYQSASSYCLCLSFSLKNMEFESLINHSMSKLIGELSMEPILLIYYPTIYLIFYL